MPGTSFLVAIIVLLFVTALYHVWSWRLAKRQVLTSAWGRKISWSLLTFFALSKAVILQQREYFELFQEGLSFQNTVQVAICLLALAWAVILLLNKTVPVAALLSGPSFWVTSLTGAYALSSLWSSWPQFTLYRSLELGVFWVITIHLFATLQWRRNLKTLFLIGIAVALAGAVVDGWGTLQAQEHIVGVLRSNTGSTIAAALLILMVHHAIVRRSAPRVIPTMTAIVGLALFGSLATAASLPFALLTLVSARHNKRRAPLVLLFGFLFITWTAYIALTLPQIISSGTQHIAQLFGKDHETIVTLSGRIPLWLVIWDISKSQPLGSGFAAGERTLMMDDAHLRAVAWQATQSHSGYVAAWLGSGWLGLMLLGLLFASLWRQSRRHSPRMEPFIKSIIVLLAINNLTIAGVGGQWNLAWVLMTALACAPVKATSTIRKRSRLRVKLGIVNSRLKLEGDLGRFGLLGLARVTRG